MLTELQSTTYTTNYLESILEETRLQSTLHASEMTKYKKQIATNAQGC